MKCIPRYDVRAYNFYLWPDHSTTFKVQSDSLRFLTSHGFNFNRLIQDGIPYLRPDELEKKRQRSEQWLREEEDGFRGIAKKKKKVKTFCDKCSSISPLKKILCR